MNRTIDTYTIESADQIPALSVIRALPRSRVIKLIIPDEMKDLREATAKRLREELHGFQIITNITEPEINIIKLITTEIEENQEFLEQCAKDYRELAIRLMGEFSKYLKVKVNKDFPMLTFAPIKASVKSKGKFNGWYYYLHGYDCCFEHKKTKQNIEVTIVHGEEFGTLDPYFFSRYIKSTQSYYPLPIEIYDDYTDGKAIIDKMIDLGRFELINSNIPDKYSAVVTHRNKVAVKIFEPGEAVLPPPNFFITILRWIKNKLKPH
jgi:hypothetical protein